MAVSLIVALSGVLVALPPNSMHDNVARSMKGGGTLPNLKAVDIWTSPDIPMENQDTTVYFKIATTNRIDVGGFYTNFYIDGSLQRYRPYTTYMADSSELTFSLYASLLAGSHEVSMYVDSANGVNEIPLLDTGGASNDNERLETITWQTNTPLPNLKAIDIWTNPDPPLGGEPMTIYYKIATTSAAAVTGSFRSGLWLAGNMLDFHEIDSLGGNSEFTFTYICTKSTGTYSFMMKVDYMNSIAEPPEYDEGGLMDDNALTEAIAVEPSSQIDSDSDGLSDLYEQSTYYASVDAGLNHYTSIIDSDSDNDNLLDGEEVLGTYGYITNPLMMNTDGDGWNDGLEVDRGQGYPSKYTDPTLYDTDSDTVRDDLDVDPLVDLSLNVVIFGFMQLVKLDNRNLNDGDIWCAIGVGSEAYYSKDDTTERRLPFYTDKGFFMTNSRTYGHTFNVPDDNPIVHIEILLYDSENADSTSNQICDIDKVAGAGPASLDFDLRTGDWSGDDTAVNSYDDLNGIGNVSGSEDYIVSTTEGDCCLWFYIYENDDKDHDGFTYYEETNILALNPGEYDSYDADGDGLENVYEYEVGSKSDFKDSDADGIFDEYEWEFGYDHDYFLWKGVGTTLSPARFWDASPFIYTLYQNLSYMLTKAGRYSFLFSWVNLANEDNFYVAPDYYHELMQYYNSGLSADQKAWPQLITGTKLLEMAVESQYEPTIIVPITFLQSVQTAAVQYMLVEFARTVLSNAYAAWDKIQVMYSGLLINDPYERQEESGVARQIGYGLYAYSGAGGKEEISTRFMSIFDDITTILPKLSPSKRNFNTEVLPLLSQALDRFGYTYDAAMDPPVGGFTSIPVKVDNSRSEYKTFITNSPQSDQEKVFQYYSDFENYLYQMAKVIKDGFWGKTHALTTGKIVVTTGDIAQDLLNMIHEAFLVVKSWKLIFTGLVYPCPLHPN